MNLTEVAAENIDQKVKSKRPFPHSQKMVLTLEECVELTTFTIELLHDAIEKGDLQSLQIGDIWSVRREDFKRFIDETWLASKPRSQSPSNDSILPIFALTVTRFTRSEGHWKGTAAQLLEELKRLAPAEIVDSSGWPSVPEQIGTLLNRIQDDLNAAGVLVRRRKSHGSRLLVLELRT